MFKFGFVFFQFQNTYCSDFVVSIYISKPGEGVETFDKKFKLLSELLSERPSMKVLICLFYPPHPQKKGHWD